MRTNRLDFRFEWNCPKSSDTTWPIHSQSRSCPHASCQKERTLQCRVLTLDYLQLLENYRKLLLLALEWGINRKWANYCDQVRLTNLFLRVEFLSLKSCTEDCCVSCLLDLNEKYVSRSNYENRVRIKSLLIFTFYHCVPYIAIPCIVCQESIGGFSKVGIFSKIQSKKQLNFWRTLTAFTTRIGFIHTGTSIHIKYLISCILGQQVSDKFIPSHRRDVQHST